METGAVLNNSAARITERSTTKAVEAEFSYLNQQLLSQSGFAIDIGTIETAPDFAIPCYDSGSNCDCLRVLSGMFNGNVIEIG